MHHPLRASLSCLQEVQLWLLRAHKQFHLKKIYSSLEIMTPIFLFLKFFLSILVFSSFLSSLMTHGLLFFSSMGRFVHIVLCCKHESNTIFCFTKLFYKAQILHNTSKHFLFWKQTALCVNQMTPSSPLIKTKWVW